MIIISEFDKRHRQKFGYFNSQSSRTDAGLQKTETALKPPRKQFEFEKLKAIPDTENFSTKIKKPFFKEIKFS